MRRSPDLDTSRPMKLGSPGQDTPGAEPAPECRRHCEDRLQECTLAGTAGKEDCRKEWRYCVYDCFCR